MDQPTGPSGVHPKNRLSPGVWITAVSRAAEPVLAASAVRFRPPASSVWQLGADQRGERPRFRPGVTGR